MSQGEKSLGGQGQTLKSGWAGLTKAALFGNLSSTSRRGGTTHFMIRGEKKLQGGRDWPKFTRQSYQ